MQNNLEKLTEDWNEIKNIVIYGAGTVSRICEKILGDVNINILCVIDQDEKKQGKSWNGIPVISFDKAEKKISGEKIVVVAAHAAYNEISLFLNKKGLTEFKDYCRVGQFICEWFWNARKLNCVYHVDMTVTTKCTLNCKHCNMFIPYYQIHENFSFEVLKSNIDLLFKRVDYVVYMGLIGGEPLLHPRFKDIITYIEKKYHNQLGKLAFTSNGTIIPSDDLLTVIKKYDVLFEISDYSNVLSYEDKINEVEDKLKKWNINYVKKSSLSWCDFGFPNNPYKRNVEKLKEHLQFCRPEWNGLNDGNFYYCNVSWSAEKSGNFKLKKEDYIVLEKINSEDKEACHQIVEMSRGTSSFCRVCGGCGKDNTNYVKAGIQIDKI